MLRGEAAPYELGEDPTPFVVEDGSVSGHMWRLQPGVACVVVMGTFDGMHAGHRSLIEAARADAARRHLPLVAVTFCPPPSELFAKDSRHRRLLAEDDRLAALLAVADGVVAFDFTMEYSRLRADEFCRIALRDVVGAQAVHVGTNFSFARGGTSGPKELEGQGRALGFACTAHELAQVAGDAVSSTRVRELLAKGLVEEAADLLGRCHYVRGQVVHGRGEGTAFGFPTANVVIDDSMCLPAEGVYACYVEADGMVWPAAANVGVPASFGGDSDSFLEANLIGFAGDLYGREVVVSFVAWIRGQRTFDSLEELEEVVLDNISWVADTLEGPHEAER